MQSAATTNARITATTINMITFSLNSSPFSLFRFFLEFFASSTGSFSRLVRISQIPTGDRRFVAHLRDLSSNGSIALADTITAAIDTFSVAEAVFNLKLVVSSDGLLEVFTKTTLPRDSTIVVVTPTF